MSKMNNKRFEGRKTATTCGYSGAKQHKQTKGGGSRRLAVCPSEMVNVPVCTFVSGACQSVCTAAKY
jgi:hypothetical protein